MSQPTDPIQVSGKVISIIMKIGYIAMIVVMGVCAVSLLFVAITGDTSIVTSAGIDIRVADDTLTTVGAAVAVFSAVLLLCAFLYVIFLLTYRVFNEIVVTGKPFHERHVRTIKTIGVLVAVMTVVGSIADSVAATYAGTKTIGIYTDSTGVLVGAIIFCLAYIYQYGCTLQKRVDEID